MHDIDLGQGLADNIRIDFSPFASKEGNALNPSEQENHPGRNRNDRIRDHVNPVAYLVPEQILERLQLPELLRIGIAKKGDVQPKEKNGGADDECCCVHCFP
jgi:hypothetical protein